jgi:hypothetical protein
MKFEAAPEDGMKLKKVTRFLGHWLINALSRPVYWMPPAERLQPYDYEAEGDFPPLTAKVVSLDRHRQKRRVSRG